MAENEIIKHTKKAYEIIKSSGKNIKHKLYEIFIEILIIVIAVSISIWFHNWNERRHDRQEEKEFFTGLKKDLQSDMENMTNSRKLYEYTLRGISYFLKTKHDTKLNQDSVIKYSDCFFSSTDLDPHIGRYEGLKSSGRFSIIENKELLNDIIEMHESIIQRIQDLNQKYYQHNQKTASLISQYAELSQNGTVINAASVASRSDFKILIGTSAGLIVNNIIPIHMTGIKKCNEIIAMIDKELK
ncbi:MAG: DUF6090 family protein [Bacteroidota bacterium]|jgi:Family of unknown function (DUF6090)